MESDNIPKLCGCEQGKCELYEEEKNENIPAGWKQGARDENIPAGWKTGMDSGDDRDGDQDLSKLSEEQRDLSESLPRSSGSSKPSSRESKAQTMRSRRAVFKEARKARPCRKQPPIEVKMMNSCEVPNSIVQDRSIPMVIIGTDVVSLYPSLRWEPAGEQVYEQL